MKKKLIFLVIAGILICGCRSVLPKASQTDPLKTAQVLAEQSNDFYRQALDAYAVALQASPDDPKIKYDLALLYYNHGQYDLAVKTLLGCDSSEAQKLLALSYYKNADYTEALSLFEKIGEVGDDDYLYAYAMTCEKHNLYMNALKLYQKIQVSSLASVAKERIQKINALMEKTDVDNLDPSIRELVKNAPSEEDFPEAGAVILLLKEDAEVLKNNTVQETQYCFLKILNERGKHLGEIEINYDSTYESVEIEFARTITPSGDVVYAGSKHIRDVSRYLNFPLYSNARAKIISMPEVAVGAFLEYKIRIVQNKMVAEDKYDTNYFLQTDSPIQHAEFTVKLPKGKKLNQKVLNAEFAKNNEGLKAVGVEAGDQTIYSWKFDNIEQLIPEPQMPPFSEITPVILLSTFESWEQIYKWWWPLAKDKIRSDEAMQAKVKELVKPEMTEREKAEALHHFCVKNIRYVGVEYGQAGYEPHPAPEIFANKYGDCKDQAVLLIALLQEAGVKAHPVLIGTRDVPKLQNDFPSLLFNHCIVAAEVDGETIFLDPTGETVLFGDLPAGDQARDVLVFFENEAKLAKTPKYPAAHNQAFKKTVLNFISPTEIKGEREVRTQGIFDQGQRAWLRYTMPSLIEETLRQKVQEVIPGGRLIDYNVENLDDIKKGMALSYDFSGSDFLIQAGENMWVVPQLGGVDVSAVSRNERNFGIDFVLPQTEISTIEINFPKEYRVKSLPKPVESDNAWFSYKHVYEQADNKIIFTEENVYKKDFIDVKDYVAYKNILEQLSKDIRQSIVVEAINGQE